MALKGNDLLIKIGGVAVAAAKSCDINVQADELETASPSDGAWKSSITGRKSWSITTNHLVVSLVRSTQMVGTSVSIDVSIRAGLGGPGRLFNGFVNNPTITEGTLLGTPSGIYWDKTRNKFLGYNNPAPDVYLYFEHWVNDTPFTSPNAYDVFRYNGVAYTWLSNSLTAEKMTGNANIATWRVTGTRGNLAQGSFEFHGTGPLTTASLPTT